MTVRYCRVCSDFHDLDAAWPEACYGHFGRHNGANSIQIIKDIEPYKAVAVDIATGKQPRIGSRSEHREFMKRNKYVEVGNERIGPRKPDFGDVSAREIKQEVDRAIAQIRSSR